MIRFVVGIIMFTLACATAVQAQAVTASLSAMAGKAPSVVFLNPGYSTEPFWVTYSDFMQAAAEDLGMQLQVLYAERDTTRLLSAARKVLESPVQPDYLLFVNEEYVGPELLRLFADSQIRLFSLHSTLTPEQQQIVGGTRERYPNWIGSLVPNDEEAGYLMASALIAKQGGQPGRMLACSGVRNTPSATLRESGLKRALAEHPEIKLQQLVYGEWARQRAYEQALQLLQRYPDVRMVWSANDEMAFGAMRAARELHRRPDKDLSFSALNNSPEALRARSSGKLCVLVGGHFTQGGWAMVMLHDYHAGRDFAALGGKDRVAPLFSLLDARQSARLAQRLRVPGYGLDFRRFIAVYRPEILDYSFSVKPLLQ